MGLAVCLSPRVGAFALATGFALVACRSLDKNGAAEGYALDASAGTVAASTTATATAALPSAFADGNHDYAGTLGARTAITMHLERTGHSVHGTYAYASTAIGHSLKVDGKVDGTILTLDETSSGKNTGTFRLNAAGTNLTGQWSDPSGKKQFPVRLSPAAAVDAGAPVTFDERAEQCLADPLCSAEEAAKLFVQSDDAKEKRAACFRFLRGSGVAQDVVRGRACLERVAGSRSCDGSSAFLETAELALLRIDGIGGEQDIAGGRTLLDSCASDVTKTTILEHAKAKEANPKTPPADFCKDIQGTTLTTNDCFARSRSEEETKAQLQAKAIARTLDDEGKRLFVIANKAYSDYANSRGSYGYEVYSDGSLRNVVFLDEEQRVEAERSKELAEFSHFSARDMSDADVSAATHATATAISSVKPDKPAEAKALSATQTKWVVYRDAEVALYVHAFAAQGADRVRKTILVELEKHRAAECAPPSLGGH